VPTKYWLSNLDHRMSFRRLVDIAKMRWRIERDYQELKQEIGLGHYEGRGWRGFHHHGTLCIAAYGFLISERETIPSANLPLDRFGEIIRSIEARIGFDVAPPWWVENAA
jgi:SRSO17 transposase